MQFAAILAVLKIIGDIAGAINNVYELVKNAEEFFSDPSDLNQKQLDNSSAEVIKSRNQILKASKEILDAIDQLKQQAFSANIADKQGDCDDAQDALDIWHTTGRDNQRDIALGKSGGALNDVLEYYKNKTYPSEALILPMSDILVVRIMILQQLLCPEFATPSSSVRIHIENAIDEIRTTAYNIKNGILQANIIRKENLHVRDRVIGYQHGEGGDIEKPGGGGILIPVFRLHVSYVNISGTVSYNITSEEYDYTKPLSDEYIEQITTEAERVRQNGIAEDIAHAKLAVFMGIADTVEHCLWAAEAKIIANIIVHRELTTIERASFIARRRNSSFRESALKLAMRLMPELEQRSDGQEVHLLDEHEVSTAFASDLLDRKLTQDEETVLTGLAQTFGKKAVLQLLLSHPDSIISKFEKA